MKPVFVLNGPNLNMLGLREPETYGREMLEDIQRLCIAAGKRLGFAVEFRQSNIEGELVSSIQEARSSACGIVINAAAYTHTSVAIHDALRASDLPVIEVHLTNVYKREPFRHKSYVSGVAVGVICGFGSHGYELAIEALSRIVTQTSKN
ncbi:MAG: type II 3-dehydroquinate dehydratase [Hyphomicrobiales bacterium]